MKVAAAAAASEAAIGTVGEDAVLWLDDPPIAAVADGMGGPGTGNVASAIAMMGLRKRASVLGKLAKATEGDRSSGARLALGRTLERLMDDVHGEIAEAARVKERTGMGTTFLAAVIAGGQAHLAQVGANRAYLFRDGRLRLLTEDHTLAMARVRAGGLSPADYRASPLRHKLYQALGTGGDVDVDVLSVELADRDWLVLVSDGVHAVLDDAVMAECLRGTAEEAAQSLLVAARANGSADDASAVVLRIASEGRPDRVDAIAQVLAGTMLFRQLTDAERLVVAPYLDHRRLAPGDALFEEGEPGDAFYVVVDGRVRITRGGTPLTEVGPGGSFGELCLARPVPRSGTVVALEDTLVLGLTRERFHEVVGRKPALGGKLLLDAMDALGDRLRDLTERLAKVERLAVGEDKPADLSLRTAIILAARGE